MESQFSEVTTKAELDRELGRSEHAPVLLYLHDPYCGLNAVARREVAQLGTRVAWIDVHAHHDLGMDVEHLTGVRHASPQALVLRDRQALWSASHRNVTAASVLAALDSAEPPATGAPPRTRRGPLGALGRGLSALLQTATRL